MSKLTLNADPAIINKAKELARQRGTSVSALFSQFIRSTAKPTNPSNPRELGPITQRASGIAKLPDDKSYDQLIDEAVMKRYG